MSHHNRGTVYAVKDISIANKMAVKSEEEPRQYWRRPDGRVERIIYPPRPRIAELMGSAGTAQWG